MPQVLLALREPRQREQHRGLPGQLQDVEAHLRPHAVLEQRQLVAALVDVLVYRAHGGVRAGVGRRVQVDVRARGEVAHRPVAGRTDADGAECKDEQDGRVTCRARTYMKNGTGDGRTLFTERLTLPQVLRGAGFASISAARTSTMIEHTTSLSVTCLVLLRTFFRWSLGTPATAAPGRRPENACWQSLTSCMLKTFELEASRSSVRLSGCSSTTISMRQNVNRKKAARRNAWYELQNMETRLE